VNSDLNKGRNAVAGPVSILALAVAGMLPAGSALAATLNGQVLGGGAPVANSTVTLWAASAGAPKQLAQRAAAPMAASRWPRPVRRWPKARCTWWPSGGTPAANKGGGDNPAIALMTVLGAKAPAKVTINEMTTIASVWTHNQFIDGDGHQGPAAAAEDRRRQRAQLRRPATGGWGGTIQDPLNSGQTPTMANFATLASVLAGCVTRCGPRPARPCSRRTGPARWRAHRHAAGGAGHRTGAVVSAERVFKALEALYPVPQGKTMRAVPYHALPAGRAQCLGSAAEVRRRRLPGRRQGDVRCRRQPLGRQQLHRRLAGQRRAVAGQRQQVRPQRQAAVADHHRLHRRRHAGRHLRRSHRPQGQRLAGELRQQVHHRVRQGRQAADAARRHQLRRAPRPDAGHHHRA
jgi:hypothetical protein